ncbi:MAG: DUF2339 domain-containing protein [Gammaproteobacteria bacterium]|nr:DUF2339 domain-containing protein [Gammaproteobacteria bacterium]MYF28706.1 DUF2339 domain-containing protein [Gammaproteobacteria bacterium]MYK45950.1 DUF2339 domain-containing protein [Gammaproteobacteria bacterium]
MSAHALIGVLLGFFVGAIVGVLGGGFGPALVFGGVIGGLGGWVLELNVRVKRLESGKRPKGVDPWRTDEVMETTVPEPSATGPVARRADSLAPARGKEPEPAGQAPAPNRDPIWAPRGDAPSDPPASTKQPGRSVLHRGEALARAWFTTGNVPVKVGVVVVLFGVAFFINYAIDRQLFAFPVWARLSTVALLGFVMLAIGWRLRRTRSVFALSLQGGGLGVLYLTTYAAFEFYALLPATVAFAAMVVVTLATGILALAQDSRVLVVLGVAGGFLAPILAATETGSHVLLFSYYVVLNAAILAIAWFKAWRLLNLLGFAFTFVIASLWGYQGYRPEHFATTEPFLILFVLMYVAVAVLFALRRPPNLRGFVDGALVFGTPLVGFALQTRLVESEAGLAWTAAGLTTLYAVLAGALWRIKDLRLLAMSFVGLALLFLTTAFPLALDDRWTGAAWAVQAATMAWFGVRNGSRLLLFAGSALHVVAVVAHVRAGLFEPGASPLVNGPFLAGVVLSLAGWMIAWGFDRSSLSPRVRRAWAIGAMVWAGAWWFWTGIWEIVEYVAVGARSVWLAFAALSAIAAMLASKALGWQRFNGLAFVLLPAMIVVLPGSLGIGTDLHPLRDFAWFAWPLAFGAQYLFLAYRESGYPRLTPFLHVVTYWVIAILVAGEVRWLVGNVANGDWPLASAVVAAAVLALATRPARRPLPWPLSSHWRAYSAAGVPVVAGAAGAFALAASLISSGDAAPIPYVPLANPLTIAAVVAGVAVWLGFDGDVRRRKARLLVPLIALSGLVLLSMEVARGVHHYADVPFTAAALAGSAIYQAGLSLVWGAAGLAGMVVGAVRGRRAVWIGGAVVMGVVIVKLFIVELGNVGTLSRVVSFLGVGLLLLVVGYFAPVPSGGDESADAQASG